MVTERSAADELVDELMPVEFDWWDLVRSYPVPALLVAALGGFALGSSRGREIVAALSTFAADAVAENVNELLGKEVL